MKTCVSSYSFGDYINENKLGLWGLIDKVADLGFDGIEFSEGAWSNGLSIDTAKKIKEHAAKRGLEIVSYCVGADFINGSGGNLKEETTRLHKQIDFAAAMGVKNMRHDVTGGFRGRKYSIGYDDALPVLIEGCREVTKYAEQQGVGTMTENHGFFSQDSNRIEKLINGTGHPNFGALIDIGNFMCADEDPAIAVGVMAPYAKHVHAKDFHFKNGEEINPGAGWFMTRAGNYIRGAIIGHGNAKVYQSIQALRRVGYDGYISIEFEGMEDKLTGIEIGLQNLKRFIG
ncbi:MAG: sugar phosphate isomerase/epimerase [Eubacteriales bacterium]|jgi:sugar phosphate isomerase/epimerase|nr:sugar phosphate isomerase/epimerase [Eubacteriales bacterium]